jgi:hypothetical protein
MITKSEDDDQCDTENSKKKKNLKMGVSRFKEAKKFSLLPL